MPRMVGNPFDLKDGRAYQIWRQWKLSVRIKAAAEAMVVIKEPGALSQSELSSLSRSLSHTNMALYDLQRDQPLKKSELRLLLQPFGLFRIDRNLCADENSITTLTQSAAGKKKSYIPYSSRSMNWHTDGYYNTQARQIHGMVLHCLQAANQGGDSMFCDHELLYIRLRDENPEWVAALMRPDVMSIPENALEGDQSRPESVGPVFSQTLNHRGLHMRYSARGRNINWLDLPDVSEARAFILDHLGSESDDILRLSLGDGQGIICRNVLHGRTAFEDSDERPRVLYRVRSFDTLTSE